MPEAKYRAGIVLTILDKLGPMFKKLTKNAKEFKNALKPANRELDKMTGQKRMIGMKRMSRGLDFMVQKTRLLKFAATAAFVAAIKVSADFEAQMFRTGFILDNLNTKEFADLRDNMRQLAGTTIFKPVEIATAAKELAKSGRSLKEINEQMPQFAKFAQLAEGDVVQMSRDFSAAFKIIAKKGESPLQFMETMSAALLKTRLTGEKLTEVFKFAGAELANFEGPTEQIAILAGTLADAMQDGSRAGTGLRSMFKRLANPTGESVKVLRQWVETVKDVDTGIDVKDIFSSKGFIKDFALLFKFIQKSNVNARELDVVFGKIAGTTLTSALGKDGIAGLNSAFERTAKKIRDVKEQFAGRGGMMAAFDIGFKKTTAGSLRLFISQMEDLAIQIGDSGLLGAVGELLKGFTPFFNWVSKLSPEIKEWTLKITLAGTAMLWLLGPIAAIMQAFAAFPVLAGPAFAIFAALVTPLTILAVLIATLVTIWVKDWGRLSVVTKQFFSLWGTWLSLPFRAAIQLLSGDFEGLAKTIKDANREFTEFTRIGDTLADQQERDIARSIASFNADPLRITAEEAKRGVQAKRLSEDNVITLVIKDESGKYIFEEISAAGNIKLATNTGQQQ